MQGWKQKITHVVYKIEWKTRSCIQAKTCEKRDWLSVGDENCCTFQAIFSTKGFNVLCFMNDDDSFRTLEKFLQRVENV